MLLLDYISARILLILVLFHLSCVLISCNTKLPTVDGPETKELITNAEGYIIMTGEHARGIIAMELPSGKLLVIKAPNMADNPIERFGGPDEKGRIAFIESVASQSGGAETEKYSLKAIDMDTRTEKTLFTRKGTYWPHIDENYGRSFSLSDRGGLISFICRFKDISVYNNTRYFPVGDIEIDRIENDEVIKTGVKAIDEGFSWSPGGDFIAYSALVPREHLSSEIQVVFEDGFGTQWQEWESIPVVSVFDMSSRSSKQLHVGLNPVVSKDGLSILLRDDEGHFRLFDISSERAVAVSVPGGSESFSMIGNDHVLYRGLPTSGSKQKFRLTSTLGILPYWTLKIANVNTRAFFTIIPYLDAWRGRLSYGRVKHSRN